MTDEEVSKAMKQISEYPYDRQSDEDLIRGIACMHRGMTITAIHRFASAAYGYEIAYQYAKLIESPTAPSIHRKLLNTHALLERCQKISLVQRTSYKEERPCPHVQ